MFPGLYLIFIPWFSIFPTHFVLLNNEGNYLLTLAQTGPYYGWCHTVLTSSLTVNNECLPSHNCAVLTEFTNLNHTHCLAGSLHIFDTYFWIITCPNDWMNYFLFTLTITIWHCLLTFFKKNSELFLEWNTCYFFCSLRLFPVFRIGLTWISDSHFSLTVLLCLSRPNYSCWSPYTEADA